MKTILEYHLEMGNPIVSMPVGAKVLTVGAQGNAVYVWAKVDTDQLDKEPRIFRIYDTGHTLPDSLDLEYLGTAMLPHLSLVLHVFEDKGMP